ncbi:unnamed protein product [Lota lota]
MAPTNTRDFPCSALSTKDRHKLRKPVVEKMRRDRINSCIEQLKALLEKDFQKQEPNTKLEKADILEMTVLFLRQQLQTQSAAPHAAHSHGYARCWKETLHFLSANSVEEGHSRCVQEMAHFLSKDEVKTQSNRRLLDHFQNLQSSSETRLSGAGSLHLSSSLQPSITEEKSSVNSAIWRPW